VQGGHRPLRILPRLPLAGGGSWGLRKPQQLSCPVLLQAAISLMLALQNAGPRSTASRLLLWGTHAVTAMVLGLSVARPAAYSAARPFLLTAARLFSCALGPQILWHAAQQGVAWSYGDSWAGAQPLLAARWIPSAPLSPLFLIA
jgi:hypothetical protein